MSAGYSLEMVDTKGLNDIVVLTRCDFYILFPI